MARDWRDMNQDALRRAEADYLDPDKHIDIEEYNEFEEQQQKKDLQAYQEKQQDPEGTRKSLPEHKSQEHKDIRPEIRRFARALVRLDKRTPVEHWTDDEVLASGAYMQEIKNIIARAEKRYNNLQPNFLDE